jgi:hypothetical protein
MGLFSVPGYGDLARNRMSGVSKVLSRVQTVARGWHARGILRSVIVDAVADNSLSPTSPLGDAIETFIRRESAERFVEEVRGEDPELAT